MLYLFSGRDRFSFIFPVISVSIQISRSVWFTRTIYFAVRQYAYESRMYVFLDSNNEIHKNFIHCNFILFKLFILVYKKLFLTMKIYLIVSQLRVAANRTNILILYPSDGDS